MIKTTQNDTFSPLAAEVVKRYLHPGEDWRNLSFRVTREVFAPVAKRALTGQSRAATYSRIDDSRKAFFDLLCARKFMPGGRYLYATGRDHHQTQNCVATSIEDTKAGWGFHASRIVQGLMSGAGFGCDYSKLRPRGTPLKSSGGFAGGPISAMEATNALARPIRQGGARRAALYASLHWTHQDIFDFIKAKQWSPEIRAQKALDFEFPAPLDHTNISVRFDPLFINAIQRPEHYLHQHAKAVWVALLESAAKFGDPGFQFDADDKILRNAPVAASTQVLTRAGYMSVGEIVGQNVTVWTGFRWAPTTFKKTASHAPCLTVKLSGGREIICDETHPFLVEVYEGKSRNTKALREIKRIPAKHLEPGDIIATRLPKVQGRTHFNERAYLDGFLFGDGHFYDKNRADLTVCTPEKMAAVGEFLKLPRAYEIAGGKYRRFMVEGPFTSTQRETLRELHALCDDDLASFLAGYFDADGNVVEARGTFRLSSVHKAALDDVARALESLGILAHVSKGGPSGYGGRRSFQLVVASDYAHEFLRVIPVRRLRRDLGSYKSYRLSLVRVLSVESAPSQDVFCCDVGVPEHCFQAEGVLVSNCTEFVSETSDDVCNLGSLNMARFDTIEEFKSAIWPAVYFLLAGTEYSDLPYPEIGPVRARNRRIGLGLMGVHEWLLKRGYRYEPNAELAAWLSVYREESNRAARAAAKDYEIPEPRAVRAIAPTGTIGIVAETTTGIEPIFAVAYKRRFFVGEESRVQYVIDPTAKRLISAGVDPEQIEDALSLAQDPARRVKFQEFVQGYVDMGISSTINLPAWGSEHNNEQTRAKLSTILLDALPKLRGITLYPDGAHSGQPITRCDYSEALAHEGQTIVEQADVCDLRGGASCGA